MTRWMMASVVTLFALAGCDDDEKPSSSQTDPTADLETGGESDADADADADTDTDTDTDADLPLDVTILHINDHHSHVNADDFGFDVSKLGLSGLAAEASIPYGGFPSLITLFAEREAAVTNPIKIHAGDAITGTLYYSLFEGQADADMMNRVCFDAFALGNHEFDGGDSGLAVFLDYLSAGDCGTPALAANVVPAKDSAIVTGYIQPYTIMDIEGQQVGLIGIDIANKTKNSSSPDEGTEFLDETETAQRYIDELEAKGVDKIVLVTHYQYDNDITLAQSLSGVDVIVGGDSHTLLGGSELSELGFNVAGDYPTVVQNADGDDVCIVQAWEYAHLLGELSVRFAADGTVESCSGDTWLPVDLTGLGFEDADGAEVSLDAADLKLVEAALSSYSVLVATTPDADALSALAVYDKQVDSLKQAVIGSASEDLCFERFPNQGRSNICDVSETYVTGSDITNIVAKAFLMVTPTADIAIQNGGGVRDDLPQGDITIADAFTLLPFSNTLVTLELTGQQIIDVLEDALDYGLDPEGSSGAYPYASGLRFEVDASQAKGSRFSNVQINARVAGSWTSIDTSATYTVVTNDYIASGQDGYATFGTVSYEDTYTEYAQGLIDYVEMVGTLSKLPADEYSTQGYTGTTGCDHSASADCDGY